MRPARLKERAWAAGAHAELGLHGDEELSVAAGLAQPSAWLDLVNDTLAETVDPNALQDLPLEPVGWGIEDTSAMHFCVTPEPSAASLIDECVRPLRRLQDSLRRLVAPVLLADADFVETLAPRVSRLRGHRRGRERRSRPRRARASTDPEPPGPGLRARAAVPDQGGSTLSGVHP